jgi:hypothetical protein
MLSDLLLIMTSTRYTGMNVQIFLRPYKERAVRLPSSGQAVRFSPLHHVSADAYGRDQRRSRHRSLVFRRHPRGLRSVRWVCYDSQLNANLFVAPGFHIALAIACVRASRRSTAFAGYPRRAHVAIAYVALLFTVATLNMGFKTAEWVDLFVDQRLAPSGPAQTGVRFERDSLALPGVANNASFEDQISRMDQHSLQHLPPAEPGLDLGSCSGQFALNILSLLKPNRQSDLESLGALEQKCPMDPVALRASVSCERRYVTCLLPERSIVDVLSFIHCGHLRKWMGAQ